MNETLRLCEQETRVIALNSDDASYLADRFGSKLTVRRAFAGDGYEVNPNQHVGVLALPSGQRLEIVPKVPVRSLFYMLAVAFEFPTPLLDDLAEFDDFDDLLEFLAGHFADLVEDRTPRGLYRAYVEREENLASVRGRIAVADDVRRNHVLRHRTFCRFSELTWDIPENQVIRQVAHLLAGWVRRPRLRLRLWRIDHLLGEVTPTQMPAAALDRFTYHRLNDDYRPIHRLCRLFLDDAALTEHEGSTAFRTFLLDMNLLFETFVTQTLSDSVSPPVSIQGQVRLHLDREATVTLRPDLVVSEAGRPTLVADCKYKRADESFRNHDVYQLLAYCTALGLSDGLLVYPRHVINVDEAVHVLNSTVRIRQISIDLGAPLPRLRTVGRVLRQAVLAVGQETA